MALIASKADLGVVPALFGRPATYARFLSSELTGVYSGPVLVVMPDGFGLAAQGRAQSVAAAKSIATGPGADRLASAALAAMPKLAAAAGHPLPAGAAASGSASGADPATVKHALEAIMVLLSLAALSCAGAFALRARRAREAVRR